MIRRLDDASKEVLERLQFMLDVGLFDRVDAALLFPHARPQGLEITGQRRWRAS